MDEHTPTRNYGYIRVHVRHIETIHSIVVVLIINAFIRKQKNEIHNTIRFSFYDAQSNDIIAAFIFIKL